MMTFPIENIDKSFIISLEGIQEPTINRYLRRHLLKLIESYIKGYKISFNQEENKLFRLELLADNFKKLFLLAAFSFLIDFVIVIVTFFAGTFVFDYRTVMYAFLLANIPILPFIFLLNRKLINDTICTKWCVPFAHFIMYLYVAVFIFWGIGLTVSAQNIVDGIHIYILFLIAILVFLSFNAIERTAIIVLSYLCFVAVMIKYLTDRNVLILNTVYVLFCVLVAWLFSFTKYLTYKRNFKDKEEFKKLAQRDSMTRLYNHEATLYKLNYEVMQSAETAAPLSVIMMDIDNFKTINDNRGHMSGDTIIKELAKAILSVTTGSDIVGRYGGDEFMIVLPGSALGRAKSVAEAVMMSAAKCTIPVTLSMGISEYMGEELNEFMRCIDKKLYKAKAEGKNRFVINL